MKPDKIERIEITKEQFKDIRTRLELSQAKFARCLGIRVRQVSRIETGESSITKSVQILAVLLFREITGLNYFNQ